METYVWCQGKSSRLLIQSNDRIVCAFTMDIFSELNPFISWAFQEVDLWPEDCALYVLQVCGGFFPLQK